jgi:arsenate reductase
MGKRILILCTGNSCRSQMAEGFLKSFDRELEVFSAGTIPADKVNPNSVIVMNEVGIDIGSQFPQDVNEFVDQSFDYVITVCDNAKEVCPVFTGLVKHRLHIPFDDPADATGTVDEVLAIYRRVRDEINQKFAQFYKEITENQ